MRTSTEWSMTPVTTPGLVRGPHEDTNTARKSSAEASPTRLAASRLSLQCWAARSTWAQILFSVLGKYF